MPIHVAISDRLLNQLHGSSAQTLVKAIKTAIDDHFSQDCRVSFPVTDEGGQVIDQTVRILVPESKGIYKVYVANVPADVDQAYRIWAWGIQPNPYEFDVTLPL